MVSLSGMGELQQWPEPKCPPVMRTIMFDRMMPIIHMGGIVVYAHTPSGSVVLAMAHPEAETGSFLGLNPEQARNIASWLISTANALDGGAKQ